jgi:hypothetical protein
MTGLWTTVVMNQNLVNICVDNHLQYFEDFLAKEKRFLWALIRT